MANPWGVWSISPIKRSCGLALAFTLLREDWSPPGNLSHQDLGSVWSCRNAAGSLKHPIPWAWNNSAAQPGSWNGSGALVLLISRNNRAFSTCLCQSSQNHSFLYCFFIKGWWNHTYWQISHLMELTNGLLQILSQWLNYELLKKPF